MAQLLVVPAQARSLGTGDQALSELQLALACCTKAAAPWPKASEMFMLQDYYREGQGSLMQCVLTPADAYMPLTNEAIAAKVDQQVRFLLLWCSPSACALAQQSESLPALSMGRLLLAAVVDSTKRCPQVRKLFPSARGLEMTWHSIVKIQQSLYREV